MSVRFSESFNQVYGRLPTLLRLLVCQSLSGPELGKLRAAGTEICVMREQIEVAYTGDTSIEGLLQHSDLWTAKLLIIEASERKHDS